MSLCSQHFSIFWHHKLVLAYLFFPFLNPEIPACFSKKPVCLENPHQGSRQPVLREGLGRILTHPLQCPREGRGEGCPHQRHWCGRIRRLSADVGLLNHAGWWRAHPNAVIITHLWLLWFLGSFPNSTVHRRPSKDFKHDAKSRRFPSSQEAVLVHPLHRLPYFSQPLKITSE